MISSIIIIVITLLFSAFFAGMEIAYVSSNKIHIEIEKTQGGFTSNILEKMTRKPSKYITTMLLGYSIALVIYGLYMGDLIVTLLAPQHLSGSVILDFFLTDGLLITQIVLSAIVILVTAEFIPKIFFQIYANSLLRFFAIPAYVFFFIFNIFSSFILWISDSISALFFKTEGDDVQQAFTKIELGNYINEQMETISSAEEVDSEVLIFKNALEFSDIKAREVMIPRTEIIAVDSTETPKDLRLKFTETGLSKILVYKESIDDIIGYIHSFELFKKPERIKSILLPVIYVPETMLAKDVLGALIKKRKSIAVVIDEYGGTSGMATVEDIVEELFGEIEDEHDAVLLIEKDLGNGHFKFSARAEIDYINETYKLDLPKSESYETLSGLIVHYTEEIPEKNGVVQIEDYQIKILDVSSTKIELVEVWAPKDEQN